MTKQNPIEDNRQSIREGSFGFLINSVSRRVHSQMRAELECVNVDFRAFANLMLLSEEDGINQSHLAQKTNAPEYFTSRSIDQMEEAGLVERRPDPKSRRARLIYLTSKGRKKATLLPPIVNRVNENAMSALNLDEKEILISLLQKIALNPSD